MKLVITSDATNVEVIFNSYADNGNFPVIGIFKRRDISKIFDESSYLGVTMNDGTIYQITTESSSGALMVDSVDGVVPTNLRHLRNLILNLML